MITGARTGRSIDYEGGMTLYEFLLFIHISATVVWIGAGLVGFAATFVTGLFMIKPASERIGAAMEREGGRLTPALRTDIRKLIVMALIAFAGVAYIVMSVRAIDARPQPAGA
jgi:hypothetical protein